MIAALLILLMMFAGVSSAVAQPPLDDYIDRLAASTRVVIGGSTFGSTSPLQVIGLPSLDSATVATVDGSGNVGSSMNFTRRTVNESVQGQWWFYGGLAGPLQVLGSVTIDADLAVNGQDVTTASGDLRLGPAGSGVLPSAGYAKNLGSLATKWLAIHGAELWVETLVAQDTIATMGGRVLVGPTTTLIADVSTVATSIDVKHNNLASGARVLLQEAGSVEWLAVTSSATAITGGYRYSVTRNLDGSGANAWPSGAAVFNTGTTGAGWIDLYSISGLKSGSELGPTIVGNVRGSSTYNDWAPRWAIGNLDGLYGYSGSTFGVAFGLPSGTHATFDAVNGIRFRSGGVTKWAIDALGNMTLTGSLAASGSGAFVAGSGAEVSLNTNGVTVVPAAGSSESLRHGYQFSSATAGSSYYGTYGAEGANAHGGVDRALTLSNITQSTADRTTVLLWAAAPNLSSSVYTAWVKADSGDSIAGVPAVVQLNAPAVEVDDSPIGVSFSAHTRFTSGGADLPQPRLKWYRATNQSVANATLTSVAFSSSAWSSGSWGTVGATPTVPRTGGYLVACAVTFAAHATGIRKVVITRNGTELARTEAAPPADGELPTVLAVALVPATAGDTLACAAYQNSGGALDLYGSGEDNTSLQIVKVW